MYCHGRTSGKNRDTLTVEEMAKFVDAAISQLGLETYYVAGSNYLPANVAAWLAIWNPLRVKGLVIASPGWPKETPEIAKGMSVDWVEEACANKDEQGDGKGEVSDEILRNCVASTMFKGGVEVHSIPDAPHNLMYTHSSTYDRHLLRFFSQGPDALLSARAAFDAGKLSQPELKEVEEKAIVDIVKLQQEIGIKSITDGEFPRHMFFDGFFDNLTGMVEIHDPPREIFKMWVPDLKGFVDSPAAKPGSTWVCKSKLKREGPMYRPQFEALAAKVPKDAVKNLKITLAAPQWYHLRHLEHAYGDVYENDAAYFADIAKAYREELADLYDAGCRNVQFDDPLLAYFCSESMLAGMKADGIESEPILDSYIKLYNDVLDGHKPDMTVGLHLCRGNFKGGLHFSEGGYDRIAKKLFQEINVDTFYLEYDTIRAGGFEPLAELPFPKTVVLGLISSKVPELEKKEELIARVHEAASFIAKGSNSTVEEALDRRCGFASHSDGNNMTDEAVRAKLALAVDVAKSLWPKDF
ncbi:hypothetical protein MNV49_003249 [Pseudohyphozyma bogoriensis]|nr:hypothetical protein MNV49_003249 [Pseudohyphozyma bogoriensis]